MVGHVVKPEMLDTAARGVDGHAQMLRDYRGREEGGREEILRESGNS